MRQRTGISQQRSVQRKTVTTVRPPSQRLNNKPTVTRGANSNAVPAFQPAKATNVPGSAGKQNGNLPTTALPPTRPGLRKAPIQPSQPGRSVQRSTSRVVQAVKYYPNLHPGAVEPVNASNIFRLNSFAGQYRLHQVNSHGVNVPNQQYNFVRTRDGEMLLHNRYRHPSIANGKQVLYAGEIFFNNGQLQWWSNGSGHYQPCADDAGQANLPMDNFYSYQQIIKGEHMRKKDKKS